MSREVPYEATLSGTVRYYDLEPGKRLADDEIIKSESFETLVSSCEDSFKRAFFAFKRLTSGTPRHSYQKLPIKTVTTRGDHRVDEIPTTIDFGDFAHEFGLPTFAKSKPFERDFFEVVMKDIRNLSSSLTTGPVYDMSDSDKEILEELNGIMDDVDIRFAKGQIPFDPALAKRYRQAINSAMSSTNKSVRETLFVLLKDMEKKHQHEFRKPVSATATIELTDQEMVDDLTKIIASLPPNRIGLLFSTDKKYEEARKWIESTLTYEGIIDPTSTIDFVERGKEKFIDLYARRMAEKNIDKELKMEDKIKIEEKAIIDAKNTLEMEITSMSEERINSEALNVFKLLSKDKETFESFIASHNIDIDIDDFEYEYIEILTDDEILELGKKLFIAKRLDEIIPQKLKEGKFEFIVEREKDNLKELLKNAFIDENKSLTKGKRPQSTLGSLKKYLSLCNQDGNPTDKLSSIKRQKPRGSFIEYALQDIKIKDDPTYDGSVFEKLARLEQQVLRDIIITDRKSIDSSQDRELIDQTKEVLIKAVRVSNGRLVDSISKVDDNPRAARYDIIDMEYILLTDPEAQELLRKRYEENGELNFNLERIEFKSRLLSEIASLRENPSVRIRILSDSIDFSQEIRDRYQLDDTDPTLRDRRVQTEREIIDLRIEKAKKQSVYDESTDRRTIIDYGTALKEIELGINDSDDYLITIGISEEGNSIQLHLQMDKNGNLRPTHVTIDPLENGKRISQVPIRKFIAEGHGFDDNYGRDATVKTSVAHEMVYDEPVYTQGEKDKVK